MARSAQSTRHRTRTAHVERSVLVGLAALAFCATAEAQRFSTTRENVTADGQQSAGRCGVC
jgi:hypothetical protein